MLFHIRKPHLLLATVVLASTAALSAPASAATLCVNPQGKHGCSSTIGAAVSSAVPGDVIQVWPGVYNEQVTITEPLSLISTEPLGAVIDATNFANGIWVDGMNAAPSPGVANVVISGFEVRNANYEGIFLTNATNITVVGNEVVNNDRSYDAGGGTCPGINTTYETNEGLDCGEGIHLMAVDHSSVLGNEVAHNTGGILVSDETGPNNHNLISENFVHDNVYDCGITLASHAPATTFPAGTHPFGVGYNTISRNVSLRNGVQASGAGVGIFAPAPGNSNMGNVVIGNILRDNGATGVAIHNHVPAAPANLNDNAIIGNEFSGNGPDNLGTPKGPTAINILSQFPITGTVIAQNTFENEAVDIGFNAPGGQLNVHFNNFSTGVAIDNLGTAPVDATENWWNCGDGPGSHRCATIQGTNVTFTPWLPSPSDNDDAGGGYPGH